MAQALPPPVTVQAKVTEPVKPPLGVTVIVEVADPPAATVAGLSAGAATAKPGDDTVKLTEVLWTVDPEVPVTVMLEVPSGVFELVLMVSVDVPEAVSDPCTKAQAGTDRQAGTSQGHRAAKTVQHRNRNGRSAGLPRSWTVTGVPPIEKSGALAKAGPLVPAHSH